MAELCFHRIALYILTVLVCVSFWEIADSRGQRFIMHMLYLLLGFDDETKIVKPGFEA